MPDSSSRSGRCATCSVGGGGGGAGGTAQDTAEACARCIQVHSSHLRSRLLHLLVCSRGGQGASTSSGAAAALVLPFGPRSQPLLLLLRRRLPALRCKQAAIASRRPFLRQGRLSARSGGRGAVVARRAGPRVAGAARGAAHGVHPALRPTPPHTRARAYTEVLCHCW